MDAEQILAALTLNMCRCANRRVVAICQPPMAASSAPRSAL